MNSPLESLSDSALSEAVAVEVAGWKKPKKEDSWIDESASDPDYFWTSPVGKSGFFPPFATSADAVLPLLDRVRWQFSRDTDGYGIIEIYRPYQSAGGKDTFSRLACIAMVLAARANKK